MNIGNVLNIAASSMSAESIRLNITASNIANANTIAGSEQETYHAKHPVFTEIKDHTNGIIKSEQAQGGVRVSEIKQNNNPLNWRIEPDNPMADKDGKVFMTDVNPIEEMVDMISASKQYQASAEIMNSVKNLVMQTIKAITNF